MSRMVDDLLTLARTEQPDFLRLRAVDLDELTLRMLDNARGLALRDWRLDGTAGAALARQMSGRSCSAMSRMLPFGCCSRLGARRATRRSIGR